ncbi:MAG: sigma-70 family RNA polymerase sigma factor [Alphaproteobacteria bacterium]
MGAVTAALIRRARLRGRQKEYGKKGMGITAGYNNKKQKPPSDETLVAQAQKGDRAAFNALQLKHQDKLSRFAQRYVKTPEAAEDVVQESFLKAYQALDKFRGDSQFSTWIRTIVANTAKEYLRFESIRPNAHNSPSIDEDDASPLLEPRTDKDPARQIAEEEALILIIAVIESLDPEKHEAFLLRELEALSYQEIADTLGSPINTVRSEIHRGRAAFKAKFNDPAFIESVFREKRVQTAKLPAVENDPNPKPF